MKKPVSLRLDEQTLESARHKAARQKLRLADYVETVIRRDLDDDEEYKLTIFAPAGLGEEHEVLREPGESNERYAERQALLRDLVKRARAAGG